MVTSDGADSGTATTDSQPSVDEFASQARRWLEGHASPKPSGGTFRWGDGDDGVVEIWEEYDQERDEATLEESRHWRRHRFDAGYGFIDGPHELGGRNLTRAYARTYEQIESEFDTPTQQWFKLGPVIGPILMAHARPHLQERYVPGLYRGDLIACELFSEPGAGSDLASATCAARSGSTQGERGGTWVVNGQKVWTSDANTADIGLVLCRTDPNRPRHHGLSTFLIDMHDPAVEVRPLRQMTGGAAFNEVFITDLEVSDDHRIGEVDGGWPVAVLTLMYERELVGAGHGRGGVGIANGQRLIELARHFDRANDLLTRQALAAVMSSFGAAGHLNRRRDLPPDARIMSKLALARNLSAASKLVGDTLGARLTADTGEWGTFAWNAFVLGALGNHIAVGTDETIKNIIGERVLGLPREPRP
ncbi:MAG: acyl-CoA dehydrogenase [Actinomycetia bacterium]|nr:acyl-CoA dehydrogenase [Actinomycetes bacterium]